MPNKNYQSGRSFEYRVKKYLETCGFLVFCTAGSHSCADLIVFNKQNDSPKLIQCKHGSAKITGNELSELYYTATGYGCMPILSTQNKMKRLVFQAVITSKNLSGDISI